jgi:carbon monoxide dehydrogenase subunit G
VDPVGHGGAAGFAKGGAKCILSEADGLTTLSYAVEAKVGGKLAQLGSRIIDGFAKKMADDFFTRFQNALEPPVEGDTAPAAGDQPKKGWFRKLMS